MIRDIVDLVEYMMKNGKQIIYFPFSKVVLA
ncbi:hypothetical protein M2373_003484 [Chryseobacterium sp. JUb7]|nr:hypothetical protein [Chryseobacterium sp. JUb7]